MSKQILSRTRVHSVLFGIVAISGATPGLLLAQSDCAATPSYPTAHPAKYIDITQSRTLANGTFVKGVNPYDEVDDGPDIQAQLNSLKEGEWLYFPKGKYIHSKDLKIQRKGVTLYGDATDANRATLHGSDTDTSTDQATALEIQADNVSVYNLRFTMKTNIRKGQPWNAAIAIWNGSNPVSGAKVVNNIITYDKSSADPADQNGAASNGVIAYKARDYLIALNTIERSLADGIYNTQGSYGGRILQNKIYQTGDDGISVVSYLYGKKGDSNALTTTDQVAGEVANPNRLAHDILIDSNLVNDIYWGRGLTVVGGRNVSIRRNTVDKTAGNAGIYIAREHSYGSWGVSDVSVVGNTLRNISSDSPGYNPGGKYKIGSYSSQGAIDVSGYLYFDEIGLSGFDLATSVQNIDIKNNTVNGDPRPAVKVGYQPDPSSVTQSRPYGAGVIKRFNIDQNSISNAPAIQVITGTTNGQPNTDVSTAHCVGNTLNGTSGNPSNCRAASANAVALPTIANCQVTPM